MKNSIKPISDTATKTSLCIVVLSLIAICSVSGQAVHQNIIDKVTYREIGPTRQSGRFVDFAVVEQDYTIFYAATGSGGLWKTVNNGISFEPIFDFEKVISIGDVAVAPSNPDIVWVGTGEANNSRSTYWGDGVYKSTDAGKTWKNLGLKESHHIGRILIHPENPDIVYVAALGHLYSENPERGLYKTIDGGETWDLMLEVKDHRKNIGVVDVAMDPSNPELLIAAAYDKVRRPWTFNPGGPGSGLYKTTDGGKTWKKLEEGLPTGMLGKIGLEISVSNPDVVYANIENCNVPDVSDEERYKELLEGRPESGKMVGDEVYRSDDKGETWRKVSPEDEEIGGGPAYYYQQVRIDPTDEEHVYILGVRMWETKDGGETWGRPFRFGGDNHAMWIDPTNPKHMLLGYDHGMGITYDAGEQWYHPDNLPLAQFYAVGIDMEYPYNVYGGLQDNGSVKGPSTKRNGGNILFEDWRSTGGGDGMYNEVDANDSRWLYNESQFGPLTRIDQKTGERKSVAYRERGLRFNWNAPIVISPHNSDVIYHGANKLLKSTFRGEKWEVISPDLTTADSAKIVGTGNIQYCTITTISESPIAEGVIWVGTDDGNVQLTKDGGKNWTLLNKNIKGNPGYWVSRVEASHFDPATAYVTYTGYRRDDFHAFIFKTTDYGETWTSIASNLPDEPINVVREDPVNKNLLFAGTEMAVYVSINGGKSWTKMKGNMPTNAVYDMKIHPREKELIVATHGRGIFITNISPLQELSSKVLESKAHLFGITTMVQWVALEDNHASYSNYDGESKPAGVIINYYLKNDLQEEVTISIYQGDRLLNVLKGKNTAGLNRVIWTMNKRDRERTDREKQQVQQQIDRFKEYGLTDEQIEQYMGRMDMEYITSSVGPGEYTVVLEAAGVNLSRQALIMKDAWYDKVLKQ